MSASFKKYAWGLRLAPILHIFLTEDSLVMQSLPICNFFSEECFYHLPSFFYLFILRIINMLVIGLNKPEGNNLLLLDIEAWLEVFLAIVLYTVTKETCLCVSIWCDCCMNFKISSCLDTGKAKSRWDAEPVEPEQ